MRKQPTENQPTIDESLLQVRHEFARSWGIDFRRIRAFIWQLTNGEWHALSDLIALNALSHWNVTHLLEHLQPWTESANDKVRVCSMYRAMMRAAFECSDMTSEFVKAPYEVAAEAGEDATRADAELMSITQIVKELPLSPIRHLDHVSATPLTCLKRALFLVRNYDLEGARVLFLGDHDLTSLALAHVCSTVEITVVDVEERILSYIGRVAKQRGWAIRTIFADFRVELPRSLKENFDLVFTDPPYTPEGMRLFLGRGIESLRDANYARLLVCYGFSERHPELGFKVQSTFHELRLANEAILPQFNRYSGAEAIASSAALYICRLTRRSLPAAEAQKVDPRIYTQGKSSEEATVDVLPVEAVDRVKKHIDELSPQKLTLVGDGWLKNLVVGAEMTSLRGYLHSMYALGGTQDQSGKASQASLAAINLYPHYDAYFVRILLISVAQYLVIAATDSVIRAVFNAENNDLLRRLLKSKYDVLSIDRASTARPGVVVVKQVSPAESDGVGYVLRYIIDHRQGKLVNAWREALVSWFARQERVISKNQARQEIESSWLARMHAASYLAELSLGDLKKLVTEVTLSLEHLSV